MTLLLGSGSPRRRFLLQSLGFTFQVVAPAVDESFPSLLPPERVPVYLARKKADALRESHASATVITADTIVILEDRILNKPGNRQEAIAMLERLGGVTHRVVTGVCILSGGQEQLFADESHVTFRPLTQVEIHHYVERYQPFDKAGAYGAQESLPPQYDPLSPEERKLLERLNKTAMLAQSRVANPEVPLIDRIEGSFFNVMGLPIVPVFQRLQPLVQV